MYSNQSLEEYYNGKLEGTLDIFAKLREKNVSKEAIIELLYKDLDSEKLTKEFEDLLNYFAACQLMPKTIDKYKNQDILFYSDKVNTANFIHELELLLQEAIAEKPEFYNDYFEHLIKLNDHGFYPEKRIIDSFATILTERNVSYEDLLTEKLIEGIDNFERINTILYFQDSTSVIDNYLVKTEINNDILLFYMLNSPDFKYRPGISNFLKHADTDYLLNLRSSTNQNLLMTLLKIVDKDLKNRISFKTTWGIKSKEQSDIYEVIKNLIEKCKNFENYKDDKGNNITYYMGNNILLLEEFYVSLKEINNYQALFLKENNKGLSAYDCLIKNSERKKSENAESLIIDIEKQILKNQIPPDNISKMKVNRL